MKKTVSSAIQQWITMITLCFMSLTVNCGEKTSSRTADDELKWTKLPNGREISPVFGDLKQGHHVTFI